MDIVSLVKTGENLIKFSDKMLAVASEVLRSFPIGKLELEDLSKIYSVPIDKLIRDKLLKGNQYGTGRFVIEYVDEKYFKLSYQLYFLQPQDAKWLVVSATSDKQDSNYLSREARMVLHADKRIEYTVKEPES